MYVCMYFFSKLGLSLPFEWWVDLVPLLQILTTNQFLFIVTICNRHFLTLYNFQNILVLFSVFFFLFISNDNFFCRVKSLGNLIQGLSHMLFFSELKKSYREIILIVYERLKFKIWRHWIFKRIIYNNDLSQRIFCYFDVIHKILFSETWNILLFFAILCLNIFKILFRLIVSYLYRYHKGRYHEPIHTVLQYIGTDF